MVIPNQGETKRSCDIAGMYVVRHMPRCDHRCDLSTVSHKLPLERYAKLTRRCDGETMKASTEDLRQRIAPVVNDGCSQPVVPTATTSVATVSNGTSSSGVLPVRSCSTPTPVARAIPPAADPDATFATDCDQWEAVTGVGINQSTMYRAQQRVGWTRKKGLIASERDEAARAAFRALWAARRLTVIDESGAQTNMTPRDSRAPRGERAVGSIPRNHAKNTTLIASLSLAGLGAAMTLDGALDSDAFVAYLGVFRVPTLKAGRIVVLDTLSVHQDQRG